MHLSASRPYDGYIETADAVWSGYNINAASGSRTASVAATNGPQEGRVVQGDPYDHDSLVPGGKGKVYGVPTTGQRGPLGVVYGPQTATAAGTQLRLAVGGWVKAIVKANATAGVTLLAPNTAGELVACASTSAAEDLESVGATAEAFAVAQETADTSSAAALKWVYIRRGR